MSTLDLSMLWIIFVKIFVTAQVKWDNHLSEKNYINQGIQQGAKLSTSLYKCYNNAIMLTFLSLLVL
jgi:hypothetical protein